MENNLFTLNFNHLITNRNIGLEELAPEIGVGKSTVGNYKNGKSFPDVAVLIKIANYFQVDVNDLLFSKLLDKSNNSTNQEDNSKKDNLLEKFNKLESRNDNKDDNKHDNKAYILDDNKEQSRVEERHFYLKEQSPQPSVKPLNQGLSPPEAEILKTEILYLKEILNSKDEVLKAKSEQIELLKDKVRTMQNQLNNLLNGKSDIQAAA